MALKRMLAIELCKMELQRYKTCVLYCVIFVLGVHIYYDHKQQTVWSHSSHEQAPSLTARSIWNTHRLTYDADLCTEFERLLREPVASNDDPQVVNLVTTLLDPPSEHVRRKTVHNLFQTPQAKAVDDLFHGQKGLFFVEAGGLDGERSSNTLWLEAQRQWEGLLVEVDPYFYTQLRGKARTAYSINACLSGGIEKLSLQECNIPTGGCGQLGNKSRPGNQGNDVPCFALESIMLALNRTTIDYFSLDVEGHEYQVLDTIPWKQITIRAITIEYPDLKGKARVAAIDKLKTYMINRGYKYEGIFDQKDMVRDMYNRDLLFVRDNH